MTLKIKDPGSALTHFIAMILALLSRQAGIVRCCLSLKFCRYFSTSVGNGLDRSGAFGRISLVEYYL